MTEKMESVVLGVVKGTKKILKWAAVGVSILFLLALVVMLTDMRRENEIKRWNWAHYTGFRVTRPTDTETEVRLGLWTDIKTGDRCTDKQYPGYPACPKQEYVVNGVPTNIPDGWWVNAVSGVLEPIPDFIPTGTPPPQVTAGTIPPPPAGVKPVFDPTQPIDPPTPVSKPKAVKTGTSWAYGEIELDVDACRHPSSVKIPQSSKVKILKRTNGIWENGQFCAGDMVQISFDGTVGWVMAIYVTEDIGGIR